MASTYVLFNFVSSRYSRMNFAIGCCSARLSRTSLSVEKPVFVRLPEGSFNFSNSK